MQLILSQMLLLISSYHVQLLSYSFIEITKMHLSTACHSCCNSVFDEYNCAYVVVLGAFLKWWLYALAGIIASA